MCSTARPTICAYQARQQLSLGIEVLHMYGRNCNICVACTIHSGDSNDINQFKSYMYIATHSMNNNVLYCGFSPHSWLARTQPEVQTVVQSPLKMSSLLKNNFSHLKYSSHQKHATLIQERLRVRVTDVSPCPTCNLRHTRMINDHALSLTVIDCRNVKLISL
jgi:hypothetical protein